MRRPPIGDSIVRGLKAIIIKTEKNLEHGYHPWDTASQTWKDVHRALRYLEGLVDWRDEKMKALFDERVELARMKQEAQEAQEAQDAGDVQGMEDDGVSV